MSVETNNNTALLGAGAGLGAGALGGAAVTYGREKHAQKIIKNIAGDLKPEEVMPKLKADMQQVKDAAKVAFENTGDQVVIQAKQAKAAAIDNIRVAYLQEAVVNGQAATIDLLEEFKAKNGAIRKAQAALESLGENATKEAKAAAQKTLEEAQAAAKNINDTVAALRKTDGFQDLVKKSAEAIGNVKDAVAKTSDETLKNAAKGYSENIEKIAKYTKASEVAEKLKGWKPKAKWAAIGAAALGIVGGFIGKHMADKKAEQLAENK